MRVALVTGGNRGIGEEVCKQLSLLGYQVILAARDIQDANLAASKISSNIVTATLDVTDDESVSQLVNSVISKYGRIDVLVNNAGVFLDNIKDNQFPSLFDMDVEVLQKSLDVNLYGALRLIKAVFPYMKLSRYGRIVNVSSGMGRITNLMASKDIRRDARSGPYYRISKSALNTLTRIVSVEGIDANILVNAVCPGWVQTRMGTKEAIRTVEEGARGIVWAATLEDNGPTGMLFRDYQPLDW
ncbi:MULTISPECIES: SDR family NAD(P)-dependent oxidoreductase [Bacillus]|uniref:SDR family NAD(P)-dependent oxidoreductase n=1 Tax=Bacillus TaxID=1386 RepID=UPI0007F0D60A|nr:MULTISPECIES: SDR family NAD(P)-dependent oxidoreductase [Bacillus]ANN35689.1 short-chain dehydrogenase [Bacillus thuringiensis serovar coreanensis]PFX72044.1 short-chain dehydrogenase [Bacillus cereus]PGD11785.1 short-chain dehydrogenase [Bacillus toyonensis]PRP92085.1 3-oxoacyl-[acyl-carrier-protein] reductase FabG [Bacillus sp. M21]